MTCMSVLGRRMGEDIGHFGDEEEAKFERQELRIDGEEVRGDMDWGRVERAVANRASQ